MADLDEEKCDPETLLLRRHKKEKKDLQGSKNTQKNIIIYVSINVLTLFFCLNTLFSKFPNKEPVLVSDL